MAKSIYENLEPTEFDEITTYPLASRSSKVTVKDFAKPLSGKTDLKAFLTSLPDILAVRSVRALAKNIIRAKERKKPIIWGIGGHVIKTGLAPLLVDLLKKGYLTALACNGAVLVHDSEIAMVGFTSEDVDATLGEGGFGAAQETGDLLNEASAMCLGGDIGIGEAVCSRLAGLKPKFREYSLLLAAFENKIPVTSHLTIGADIGHFHPNSDGSAMGQGSHLDFRLFTSIVREMNGGGVYLNCGSAVTLPEIFLKAVTVNRNLGHELLDLTTANLDFIQHYRPLANVVRRPNANGAGTGFAVTGHHELMIPLLAAHILTAD